MFNYYDRWLRWVLTGGIESRFYDAASILKTLIVMPA